MHGALAKTAAELPMTGKLLRVRVLVFENLPSSGRPGKPNCLCQRELREALSSYLAVARLDQYRRISRFDVLWLVNGHGRGLETRP
jgi:hypothetical protein